MSDKDQTLEVLAAVMAGDCWLSADACAFHLGMTTPDGKVNRRGFLERIACLPNFPPQNPKTRSWRKSEVSAWHRANPSLRMFPRKRTDKELLGRPSRHKKAALPTCLYRHFDADGKLLYVGISLSAAERLSRHGLYSGWYASVASVTLQWHPTRTAALAAERAAIKHEHPVYNVVGRPQ